MTHAEQAKEIARRVADAVACAIHAAARQIEEHPEDFAGGGHVADSGLSVSVNVETQGRSVVATIRTNRENFVENSCGGIAFKF